jgi:hypothetical protein
MGTWSIGDALDQEVHAMSVTQNLSYSHGASAEPLLGETIGDNLRRMAAAHAAS